MIADPNTYSQSTMCSSDCVPRSAGHSHGSSELTHFFTHIFDAGDWPARWHCGTWSDFHGWLYIVSDLMTWLAYFMIPVLLMYMIRKRTDIPFPKIIWLFVAFIVLCGLTHLIDAVLFWWPAYRLSAMVRMITAIVSVFTVYALYRVLPQVMSLRSVAELETEIREKNAAQQSARTTHELLMESYQQLNTLTHILSHNLKNHAANMTMLVSLVEPAQLSEGNLLLVEKMGKVSEGLTETLHDLGEAMKVRENNVNSEIISIEQLVSKILQVLDAEFLSSSAEVKLDLAINEIFYPKLYLESILVNLLSNALKYRNPERNLKIELRSYINEDGRKVIECEDNGVGIDLALYGDKIFGLYQTFHGHVNAHGVGLFLVKSQVESQGGSITVSSQPDQGAIFKIIL